MTSQPDKDLWRSVGEWRLEGERVYIGDSWSVAEGLEVPVTPGTYDIEARIFWYGEDERVASLRAWLREATPDGERDAGEFAVDVASAGVIDATALDRWRAADPPAYEAWQERFRREAGSAPGFFPCEPIGGSMLFTSTGFGDGTYRVTSLLQGDRPVGFEAHFIEEGQRGFGEVPLSRGDKPRAPPSALKALLLLVVMVPVTLFMLLLGVTLGLFGWVALKIARLLSRFR